jgi:hypothetical protein
MCSTEMQLINLFIYLLIGIATTQGFWSPEHITQFEDLTLDQNFNTVVYTGFNLGRFYINPTSIYIGFSLA